MLDRFCSQTLPPSGKYWQVLTCLLSTDFYQCDGALVWWWWSWLPLAPARAPPLSLSGTILQTHCVGDEFNTDTPIIRTLWHVPLVVPLYLITTVLLNIYQSWHVCGENY